MIFFYPAQLTSGSNSFLFVISTRTVQKAVRGQVTSDAQLQTVQLAEVSSKVVTTQPALLSGFLGSFWATGVKEQMTGISITSGIGKRAMVARAGELGHVDISFDIRSENIHIFLLMKEVDLIATDFTDPQLLGTVIESILGIEFINFFTPI
jgi:hypothetical protein